MLPAFVKSKDGAVRGYGVGKPVDTEGLPGAISYFVSPSVPPVERVVAPESICEVELAPQERIFFRDGNVWRVGRLEHYVAPDELSVRLPNKERARIRVKDAFVRSNLPLESPLSLLQTRSTETPFWHEGRASFVRALAEQRAVYRGLAALASANIEILRHQLTVIHRVLTDPVPRYLLADEVGLGKTIEAGLIIKQHLFDEPDRALVVVAVPENLVAQWETELRERIHLEFGLQLYVVGHSELERCYKDYEGVTLLVIDEAHEVTRYAYERGEASKQYRAASHLAERSDGVLLLSATPVLHNEDAFLAMLHLLDPDAHSLEDLEGFQRRVAHREVVAAAVRDLEDQATGFFIEPALEQLTPLAATSPQLADLVAEVTALLDHETDDSNRQQAIAKLRAHLQECYRIDRRLLRTRRAQERVKDDLPCRTCEAWNLEDRQRSAVFEWIDQWRFNAADAEDVEASRATFMDFVEAGLAHPTVLAAAIDRRRRAIVRGEAPLFADEAHFLETAPPLVPVSRDPRVDALVALVDGARRKTKWVVFVSDPAVADELARAIESRVRTLRLAGDATAVDTLARFRDDADLAVLICDKFGEHGVNLQGLGAKLIHFDLPLSPNRIEQRIGRLDRLEGDRKVVSYVPVVTSGKYASNFEAAWARCLMAAVGVFDRSVASLQHVLDAGRNQLGGAAVDGGVDAIDDLRDAWQAPSGPLSLSQELRRVEAQDLIDQLDDDKSEFFEAIEEYEYATEPSLGQRFRKDLCDWAVRSLHFECYSRDGSDHELELEHTHHTLLAANHTARLFKHSLERARRRKGPCTGWMTLDRQQATKSRVPLARIGHPFIEDLRHLTEWDDRGCAYACWRVVPDYERRFKGMEPEDVFFRFDFVVEPNVPAVAEQARQAGLSIGAVSRRAEEAFGPVFHTIWVDVDGTQVTDAELLEELNRPYDRNTDTNLRDSRWAKVDDLGLVANWSRVCEQAETAARRHLGEAIGLDDAVASAVRQVKKRARHDELLLEARLAVSETGGADTRALEVGGKLSHCLRTAVEDPRVRLDSVGAVFVSARNPFRG